MEHFHPGPGSLEREIAFEQQDGLFLGRRSRNDEIDADAFDPEEMMGVATRGVVVIDGVIVT